MPVIKTIANHFVDDNSVLGAKPYILHVLFLLMFTVTLQNQCAFHPILQKRSLRLRGVTQAEDADTSILASRPALSWPPDHQATPSQKQVRNK